MTYHMKIFFDHPQHGYFEWVNPPNGQQNYGLSARGVVDSARLPDVARLTDNPKNSERYDRVDGLFDIHPMPGLNMVSERFRNLVELFEPGLHFFKPIRVEMFNGERYDGSYYIFSARQAFDFLLTKESGLLWSEGCDDPSSSHFGPPALRSSSALGAHGFSKNPKQAEPKVCISKPAVDGKHIFTGWRGQIGDGVFFSDQFHKEFIKAKFKYLALGAYCTELDVPWDAHANFKPALDWLESHEPRSEAEKDFWDRNWLTPSPSLARA